MLESSRRIPVIKAFHHDAVALAGQDPFRMFLSEPEGILDFSDRDDFRGTGFIHVAFGTESAEDVNDDRQSLRLPGSFQKMKDADVHIFLPFR